MHLESHLRTGADLGQNNALEDVGKNRQVNGKCMGRAVRDVLVNVAVRRRIKMLHQG